MNFVLDMYDNVFHYFGNNAFLGLLILIIVVIGIMKVFEKAGENFFWALIPLVNVFVLCKIALKNGWYFLLLLIPIIGEIFYFVLIYNLAKRFNKGILFTLGLIFFMPLFIAILGFDDSKYIS